MKRFIRSASLTNYAEVARAAGLDVRRMLREFKLPQACLTEIELKIPIEAVRSLLEASAAQSGVEAFGLLMAENRRLSNLGPLGLLMREQPTMRQALEALAHYANRMNEALFLTIEDAGEVVVLREELVVGGGSVRQSTELAIGVAFRALQALLGPAWKPRRVCFAHHAPADRSVHERVFGRGVEFGHDFNGIVCRRGDLEIMNPQADPVAASYARGLVEADLSKRTHDIGTQVRRLVLEMLGHGKCTIDEAARRLGTTRRTVHRRLHAEGLTFSAIVEATRRELAARYVVDKSHSLAEISMRLGFSAPSGFSRWYRRIFEAPASQHRKHKGKRAPA